MDSKNSKYKKFINGIQDGVGTVLELGISISQAIPVASNIVLVIDRIMELVQKATSNKALCNFIGERLYYARSMLETNPVDDSIDVEVLNRYLDVLNAVEERIKIITEDKDKIKVWINIKNFTTAKELEQELMLLYYALTSANDELSLSIMKATHKNLIEMQGNVTKINTGVDQLQKDIHILAMNLDMDGWKTENVMLKAEKITELQNQPRVIRGSRGQVVKKKYLTQDVAQISEHNDELSLKVVSLLKLLTNCENVIKLKLYLITEWCEHGNLEEYLLKNKELDWNIRVNIAMDIANGIVFCHDRDILHRDIRTSNILLDARLRAKLSNFKWARRVQSVSVPKERLIDVSRYTAPEKLKDDKYPYSKRCDIYSFGIVLWVIAVQEVPYANMENFTKISKHVLNENRPEPVDESIIPKKYIEIMKEAWSHLSSNRKSADVMYNKLSKCLTDDDDVSSITLSEETAKFNEAVGNHGLHKYEEAWPIFRDLASANHTESMFYLGYYYEKGYVVPQNIERALKYYRKSANADCSHASYNYARVCSRIAHEYMEKAAKLGHFSSGMILTEWSLIELRMSPLRDKCNRLLSYLDADKEELRRNDKFSSDDRNELDERIEYLRKEIMQILDYSQTE
ncbi:3350_t:CDS:2 [Acaulospora colombiana]|uniref:3350_t:CDS:1 n=1 Tax=Acaulospora colombiana TaxID=27376 RepID=A0ACA9JW72_9GLOM|nr:3350_t:CDS:2 [Acaulospora colombiana]